MERPYEISDFFDLFGKICLILVIFIVCNSMLDDLLFRVRYSFPTVSTIVKTPIDTSNDPMQLPLSSINNKISKKGPDNNKIYTLTKVAQYSISGMVVAKNTNFWFRGINRSDFDGIALMDVGLVWGDLADKNAVKRNIVFKSKKTLGSARVLYTKLKNSKEFSFDYVLSHSSHTHLIPANANVMSALLKMKKYTNVKLDGYLVDITYENGKTAYTSDSRTDNNASSRGLQTLNSAGGGACENMYVESVQIDGKIYK